MVMKFNPEVNRKFSRMDNPPFASSGCLAGAKVRFLGRRKERDTMPKQRRASVAEVSAPVPDVAANDEAIEKIGQKLRALRKASGLSLTELAARTGFSIGFLSQVERDLSNLSVKALFDLSRALGVNISYFFDAGVQEEAQPAGPIVRAHERRKIFYGQGVCDELASPASNTELELLWSRFAPGASSGEHAYHHNGQEAGIVITGRLDLVIGGETYRLEAGDSFGFESSIPHRYSNPGLTEAIVVWAITPPTY
jgi:transcriptional regulator with XRE-family HTH domain